MDRRREWGVQANVRAPHRFMRFGAKVTVVFENPGSASERMKVYGLSRGGRGVRAWMDARDLNNYRPKWIAEQHEDELKGLAHFETKEEAAKWCEWMQERYGNGPMRDTRPEARAVDSTG